MKIILQHLTYANVVSTLALFLVLGGMAYAATGGDFILGRSNSASSFTKLTSSSDTATLGLYPKTGFAPIHTYSEKVNKHFNADLLDGLNSNAFARTDGQFVVISASGATLAVASCPVGTKLTGGGGAASRTWLRNSRPFGSGWLASAADPNGGSAGTATAFAICYNPLG